MLLFLLVVAVAQGKTVRYSNVPPRAAIATKTYDLEVPGSAPIRIIEAEPIWNPEVVTTPFEHRGSKPKKRKSSKDLTTSNPETFSESVTQDPGPLTLNTDTYSPEALNSFLKDYAQKMKDGRKKFDVNYEETTTTEEPINKLASIYLENERMDGDNDHDKSKSWGLMDMKRHKHPYDDKKGWVTLEAVPWSTSKISKWQSNNKNEQKPWENQRPQTSSNWGNKHSNNPYKNTFIDTNDNYHGSSSTLNVNTHNNNNNNNNNYNDNDYNNGYEDQEAIFNDKPVVNYDADIRPSPDYPPKPNFPQYFNTKPDYPQYTNPKQDYPQYTNAKPDFPQYTSKPAYGTDTRPIKIKPDPSDWSGEIPQKPSWNLRPVSPNIPQSAHNSPVPDPWLDRNPSPMFMYGTPGYQEDIITDGRPSDFPKGMQNPVHTYEPIQERPTVIAHHPTHPVNGNGEWVLVSTTKGYQYPRTKHQRSIEVTPDSVGTRRGIRLTVLPPDSAGNINMTTSHGGILEVESTFETVEESHNKHVASSDNSPAPNRKKQKKKPVRHQVVHNRKPKPGQQKRPYGTIKQNHAVASTQDATAVLAAVGAGMVPATMAMLVPFVSGRRRRNVETNENKFQEKIMPVKFL